MEKTAIQIVRKLQGAGYEAYFAGGSVRDLLMGNSPQDYDIATSAKPHEIEKLISKTIPVGKKFGVMIAVVHGHHFEVATFRSDSSFSDGRRPHAVYFRSAKEDAARRDFTINGLFYDPIKKQVIDYVGGQKDIQNKVIRFIGEPHERVKEDHLRLLRAVRFKNQFGFKYDSLTMRAIADLAHFITKISKERVKDEFEKMLLHPTRAHSMRELDKFGILELILPEIIATKNIRQPVQYHQEGDVFTHLLKSLHDLPQEWSNPELVWAVLFHDLGKPSTFKIRPDRIHFDGHAGLSAKIAEGICRRLKFSRAETTKITWLIAHHMTIGFIPEMRRAHQIGLFMHPWFIDLMRLHYADETGSLPVDLSLYKKVMGLYEEYMKTPLLPASFKPILTGKDIMKFFKLKPCPQIKHILQALHEEQIEGKVKTQTQAKKFVKKFLAA